MTANLRNQRATALPIGDHQEVVVTSESPTFRPAAQLRNLARYSYVLGNLVRKDLKVKYTSSVLGAVWSMLNPLAYLLIFSLVFTFVLRAAIPWFPVYLLSGLLAWNLFSASLSLGVRSIVDNSNLVKKIYFPRELLPLSSLCTASVDLAIQAAILLVFMIAFGYHFLGPNLLLLPLALLDLFVLTLGLTLWVASLNVRYRDVQHLLNLALLMWFWFTPIVYPSASVTTRLAGRQIFDIPLFDVFLLNPMTDVVLGFQRALYATVAPMGSDGRPALVLAPVSLGWLAGALGVTLVGSTAVFLLGWRTFFHKSGDFAEDL